MSMNTEEKDRFGMEGVQMDFINLEGNRKYAQKNIEGDNIEKIRKEAIEDIIEKIRKNKKFLNPNNKERLEYQEKLKFGSGYDFTCWMQKVGIMKNPIEVRREYDDKKAQDIGFKDCADRRREQMKEWRHETGRNFPKEINEDCATYFGEFTENLMIQTFEGAIKMPYGNPGFDWTCKRGDKIDNKGACILYIGNKYPIWKFSIRYNNIADWFILSAWDNRDSLKPLYVWAFHKNDMVRRRKFWRRDTFGVTNTLEKLKELEEWEVCNRLDKLKELCSIDKNM